MVAVIPWLPEPELLIAGSVAPPMRASDAAHHLARFSVTDAGDRAGIDDIDIRVIAFCRAVPVPDEKGTHRVTVILVHLAAKCDEGHGFLL